MSGEVAKTVSVNKPQLVKRKESQTGVEPKSLSLPAFGVLLGQTGSLRFVESKACYNVSVWPTISSLAYISEQCTEWMMSLPVLCTAGQLGGTWGVLSVCLYSDFSVY